MSVADTIAAFFEGKGLSPAQAAGIVGNAQVESSFNPSALNPNEGAIGIFQWEGARRVALQQWAAAMGTTETNLNAQLTFAWHELQTDNAGALAKLQATNSPESAAAAWDQYYERSAGTSRLQRVQDAVNYYTGAGGGPVTTTGSGSVEVGPVQSSANVGVVSASSAFGPLFWADLKTLGQGNPNSLGAVAQGLGAVTNTASTLVNAVLLLFRPSFWLRVGAGLAGFVLLIIGIVELRKA